MITSDPQTHDDGQRHDGLIAAVPQYETELASRSMLQLATILTHVPPDEATLRRFVDQPLADIENDLASLDSSAYDFDAVTQLYTDDECGWVPVWDIVVRNVVTGEVIIRI